MLGSLWHMLGIRNVGKQFQCNQSLFHVYPFSIIKCIYILLDNIWLLIKTNNFSALTYWPICFVDYLPDCPKCNRASFLKDNACLAPCGYIATDVFPAFITTSYFEIGTFSYVVRGDTFEYIRFEILYSQQSYNNKFVTIVSTKCWLWVLFLVCFLTFI